MSNNLFPFSSFKTCDNNLKKKKDVSNNLFPFSSLKTCDNNLKKKKREFVSNNLFLFL